MANKRGASVSTATANRRPRPSLCLLQILQRGDGPSDRQSLPSFPGFRMRVAKMRAPPRPGSKDRRLAFPLAAATAAIAALIRDNIGLLFMALMVMPAPRGPVARTLSFRRRKFHYEGIMLHDAAHRCLGTRAAHIICDYHSYLEALTVTYTGIMCNMCT